MESKHWILELEWMGDLRRSEAVNGYGHGKEKMHDTHSWHTVTRPQKERG